jgi:hypothetical protein
MRVSRTSDSSVQSGHKVLLYSHHGYGKTYQCRNFQARYGKGLLLSGEAGLKSIEDVDIDYVPFTSWDGPVDEEAGTYSFRAIIKELSKPGYLAEHGYNWIAIDSLTELSERLIEHLEKVHAGSGNGFAMWGDYQRLILGALKWVRDLPIHVYVTCLAKEEKDGNDVTQYWPLVKGQSVSKHVPAIFDHVLCGVRVTERNDKGTPKVKRYVVTDEVSGWHGKVRDPRGRLKAFEAVDDVTALLERMTMSDAEYDALMAKTTPTSETGETK